MKYPMQSTSEYAVTPAVWATGVITEVDVDTDLADAINDVFADKWAVIVLNDDVTTFETVIRALTDLFGHSREGAEELAWRVHREGQAVVAVLSEQEARDGVEALHRRLIQAHCEPV